MCPVFANVDYGDAICGWAARASLRIAAISILCNDLGSDVVFGEIEQQQYAMLRFHPDEFLDLREVYDRIRAALMPRAPNGELNDRIGRVPAGGVLRAADDKVNLLGTSPTSCPRKRRHIVLALDPGSA
jgi:hypothetical protein